MATPLVYRNGYLNIATNDLTAYVSSLTINKGFKELDNTVMGNAAEQVYPGMEQWSIDVEFNQSFAAGELDSILYPLVGAAAASAIIVKPNGSSTSTSNPKWTGNGRILEYSPADGSVGDLGKTKVTIKCGDGATLLRATAD